MVDDALFGLIFRMWMYAGYLHSKQHHGDDGLQL
jgi:hypothetical protein